MQLPSEVSKSKKSFFRKLHWRSKSSCEYSADQTKQISSSQLPSVLCDCILYLKEFGLTTTGLFRVPGEASKVKFLQEAYHTNKTGVLQTGEYSVHDVAGLLKLSIRQLEIPLVPFHVYKKILREFRKVGEQGWFHRRRGSTGSPGAENLANSVCEVALKNLSDEQIRGLSMILNLLFVVSSLSAVNKMTTQALAIVFAPTLMSVPDDVAPQVVLRDMPIAIAATKILIENASALPTPDMLEILENSSVVA